MVVLDIWVILWTTVISTLFATLLGNHKNYKMQSCLWVQVCCDNLSSIVVKIVSIYWKSRVDQLATASSSTRP